MGLFPTEKLAALFKKKQEVLGLDVGSSGIKLVQLGLGPSGYVLQAMALIPLPPDTISEGAIKDPPTVVTAIKEAVTKAGVKEKAAIIAVSGRELSVQKFQLPKVPLKERDNVIRFEAEQHIPFPIGEVYFDYQIVAETPEEAGTMDVMLVAAKQSKVNEYVAVVEGAGLNPVVVDLDSFALQNQFELNNPELTQDVVALIDIGASLMKTNVIRGGSSIFARDVPFGGNSYTQAIAEKLQIPFEKAEAAKRRQEEGVSWDDIAPAVEEVSRDLSLEMQRTFDYIASTAEAEQIGRIVLSGGCARLAGLDEFLASSWGIPVEICKPFQNIEFDPGRFSAEELEAAGPMLAVAVGLGMRRPGDKSS